MTAHQLLQELGLAMGLPTLKFDDEGCARLMFDGKLAVNLEYDEGNASIQLYSVLGPLPAQGREALFLKLLKGNLFGADTGGATLAVDGEHHEVVLCRTLPVEETTAAAFVAAIERFVAALEAWIPQLDGAGAAAPAASAAAAAQDFSGFLRA